MGSKSPKQQVPLEQAWKNWIECLKGEDTNSIFIQISTMIWDTAIFHIIVETRKEKVKKNPQDPEINGSLHNFIDRNYLQAQCSNIRRLIDKASFSGDKGVYSLTAMINDILSYRNELTREKVFKLKNIPYNYFEIQEREKEYQRTHILPKVYFVPDEYKWEYILDAHETFDRLSGTTPDKRKQGDLIEKKVFNRLNERIKPCDSIKLYVDKFVAHSATPKSQSICDPSTYEITFNQICEAQRSIFEVANFLYMVLCSQGQPPLPFENSNFYDYWDKPFIDKGEIEIVRASFDNYRKETEDWFVKGTENMWNWIDAEK